jgi:hypothetical protein
MGIPLLCFTSGSTESRGRPSAQIEWEAGAPTGTSTNAVDKFNSRSNIGLESGESLFHLIVPGGKGAFRNGGAYRALPGRGVGIPALEAIDKKIVNDRFDGA